MKRSRTEALEKEAALKERMRILEEKQKNLDTKEKLIKIKERINESKETELEKTKKIELDKVNIPKIEKEDKKEDKKELSDKNKKNKLEISYLIILLIFSFIYVGYNMFFNQSINVMFNLIYSIILSLMLFIYILFVLLNNKVLKIMCYIIGLILIILPITYNLNMITYMTKPVVTEFTSASINDALLWCKNNNITVIQLYEYSDYVKENHIISQSVKSNTQLSEVKEITFVVSLGPNPNKEYILPYLVNSDIETLVKIIKENYLTNIEINYIINDNIKKDVIISQSNRGNIRRNEQVVFEVSLGREDELKDITINDLTSLSLFDATLYLKRNGLKYKLEYSFSNDIMKNYVISQSDKAGSIVSPQSSNIVLIISKGREIQIPDFINMSIDEVYNFAITNNLKINVTEEYNNEIETRRVISSNYKKGDVISSSDPINIVISKGKLIFPGFENANLFRDWIISNGLKMEETAEYNDTIPKDEVIRYSLNKGDAINKDEVIIVIISKGKAVIVPNYFGMSKNNAINKCDNVGLNCTFSYSSSTREVGTVISQSVRGDSTVSSGTRVVLTISTGIKVSTDNPPVVAPIPTCDRSATEVLYLPSANTGNELKMALERRYIGYKFNYNFVDSCPNGSIASGTPCNALDLDGKNINKCDSYTITIVR